MITATAGKENLLGYSKAQASVAYEIGICVRLAQHTQLDGCPLHELLKRNIKALDRNCMREV